MSTFTDGPSLRDNRRGKLMENQKEATQVWNEFFGVLIQEVRWDLFEDFLYLTSETFLGKHVSVIKNTKWGNYFMALFSLFAKKCESTEFFKELPEIPFTDSDVIYKGHTVRKSDWISHVEK